MITLAGGLQVTASQPHAFIAIGDVVRHPPKVRVPTGFCKYDLSELSFVTVLYERNRTLAAHPRSKARFTA